MTTATLTSEPLDYAEKTRREDVWESLPIWVQDAFSAWQTRDGQVTRAGKYAVIDACQEKSFFARAWLLTIQNDDNATRTLRITR